MEPKPQTRWTDQDFETAKQLWRAGNSGTTIAERLNGKYSRAAVIGKLHREGVVGNGRKRKVREKKPAKVRNPVRLYPAKHSRPIPLAMDDSEMFFSVPAQKPWLIIDPTGRMLPLDALERNQCRFACNQAAPGEQHLFCGHPVVPGKSWCSWHTAKVFTGGRVQ